jgi:hypothetical protein
VRAKVKTVSKVRASTSSSKKSSVKSVESSKKKKEPDTVVEQKDEEVEEARASSPKLVSAFMEVKAPEDVNGGGDGGNIDKVNRPVLTEPLGSKDHITSPLNENLNKRNMESSLGKTAVVTIGMCCFYPC